MNQKTYFMETLLLIIVLTSAIPAHAMEPQSQAKEISLAQLQQLYNEDLTAIEQSDNPVEEIATRREKYAYYNVQLADKSYWYYRKPQWLHAAAAQGKEKLIAPLIQSQAFSASEDPYSKYPMDYALEQGHTNVIAALFSHGLIQSRVIQPGGLVAKTNISDEAMVYYVTKLTALKECQQVHLAAAAASLIECCSDETIRKCFFQGLLNPALSEGATPVDLRMGMFTQQKLAIALEKTITAEAKKQSWDTLPQELALFKENASKGDLEDDQEAEQYYDLLHKIYFFIKARKNYSKLGDPVPPKIAISESMAHDIQEIIRTHKSLNASNHTFLCAGAILHYLFYYEAALIPWDTYFPLYVNVLPRDKVESCLSVTCIKSTQKVKDD